MTSELAPVMTPVALHPEFLSRPITHRGRHGPGLPENSLAAARAAIAAGYGIELDVQPSADGVAMVFHDPDLDRMTAASGPIRTRNAAELGAIALVGGTAGIPTLAEFLRLVSGRVPVLIEVKSQDDFTGEGTGPLEAAVAQAIAGYDGPLALMSFNPHSVAELARLAPDVARGLTTWAWPEGGNHGLPEDRAAPLRAIADYEALGCSFISHEKGDLDRPRVAELKAQGAAILSWTVRSRDEEEAARRIAHNITFEGYTP